MPANGPARWLAEARAHFTTVYGPQAGRVVLVLLNDLGEQIRIVLPPEPSCELSPTAEAILEALRGATGPLTPKVLARRAGCRHNSHFRAVVTDLARRGLVARSPDGVTLADASRTS